jgi:ubiquinone/menaquinone biosynthesis C-methylase UbiE
MIPNHHARSSRLARALFTVCALVIAVAPLTGQLGSRPADEWAKLLDSHERVAGLHVDRVVAALGLRPGQVVADLGAGTGVFSAPLAKAVAPSGRVYAVEIDAKFFDYIKRRASDEKLANVVTVLGRPADPALPAGDVDLAFMHDVLHHVADREGYLKNAVRYLKPSGRFAIADLNPATGAHRDDPSLQITKEQVNGWMKALGFGNAREVPISADKWFVIYSR